MQTASLVNRIANLNIDGYSVLCMVLINPIQPEPVEEEGGGEYPPFVAMRFGRV